MYSYSKKPIIQHFFSNSPESISTNLNMLKPLTFLSTFDFNAEKMLKNGIFPEIFSYSIS